MWDQEQASMQNGVDSHLMEADPAPQTASDSSSGPIGMALMNGVASGVAIISTGLHAAAEVTGFAQSGNAFQGDDDQSVESSTAGKVYSYPNQV
jgi:hypothetical protein